jgi:hypothetical protein
VKYMLLIMGFREGEGMPPPPSSGTPSVEEFMAYQQELGQAGVHVDSGLLHSFEDATQVQVNDAGERLVTNGPFAESREYLGGYQIIGHRPPRSGPMRPGGRGHPAGPYPPPADVRRAPGHRPARAHAAAQAYRRASELAQTPAEIAYLSSRAEKYATPD